MDLTKRSWIDATALQAQLAGHLWPNVAACEAALESNFGQSELARKDNNLFGMKQHDHPTYGSEVLPTREFEGGQWKVVNAVWIHYPDLKSCFVDRMKTLIRLAPYYPHYEAALEAPDPVGYLREVSKTWSTDPKRFQKVLDIFDDYLGIAGLRLGARV